MRANGNERDDCRDRVFSLGVTLRSHRRWLRLVLTKVTLPLTIRPTCVAGGDQESLRVVQTCNLIYLPSVSLIMPFTDYRWRSAASGKLRPLATGDERQID